MLSKFRYHTCMLYMVYHSLTHINVYRCIDMNKGIDIHRYMCSCVIDVYISCMDVMYVDMQVCINV